MSRWFEYGEEGRLVFKVVIRFGGKRLGFDARVSKVPVYERGAHGHGAERRDMRERGEWRKGRTSAWPSSEHWRCR